MEAIAIKIWCQSASSIGQEYVVAVAVVIGKRTVRRNDKNNIRKEVCPRHNQYTELEEASKGNRPQRYEYWQKDLKGTNYWKKDLNGTNIGMFE